MWVEMVWFVMCFYFLLEQKKSFCNNKHRWKEKETYTCSFCYSNIAVTHLPQGTLQSVPYPKPRFKKSSNKTSNGETEEETSGTNIINLNIDNQDN